MARMAGVAGVGRVDSVGARSSLHANRRGAVVRHMVGIVSDAAWGLPSALAAHGGAPFCLQKCLLGADTMQSQV